jgi:hypothetical protein
MLNVNGLKDVMYIGVILIDYVDIYELVKLLKIFYYSILNYFNFYQLNTTYK